MDFTSVQTEFEGWNCNLNKLLSVFQCCLSYNFVDLLFTFPFNCQDDDEWDDYRENKKDYTGLKIENLTVEDPTVKPEEEKTEVASKVKSWLKSHL